MRYLLIANNDDSNEEVYNLREEEHDNLILFNKLRPFFKYDFLQNFKNITAFSRKTNSTTEPLKSVYLGMELISKNEHRFNKIIFHRRPECYAGTVRKACVDSLEHFGFLNSPKTSFLEDMDFKKIYQIKNKKSLSSGLIAYLHVKMSKNAEDKIILVGFTHEFKAKNSVHDGAAEKAFFDEEIRNKQCFLLKGRSAP